MCIICPSALVHHSSKNVSKWKIYRNNTFSIHGTKDCLSQLNFIKFTNIVPMNISFLNKIIIFALYALIRNRMPKLNIHFV